METALKPGGMQEAPLPSLRANFTWTFGGNACYAAGQWAILSLIAKLGGAEMLGQYALALAVASPIAMLFHLNLRAVLATDSTRLRPFGDYLAVRFATAALGIAVIAAVALAGPHSSTVAEAIVLIGLAQTSENVSDIYYGAMQRRERMDQIAKSMTARAALSVGALGVTLWFTRDLVYAAAALAAGRLAVLLFYDRSFGSRGERLARTGFRPQLKLLRTALPLGMVLMLVSLNNNFPRYVIERYLGTRELGTFAAVASFVTIGSSVVNALGQAALPRLARSFGRRDWPAFRRLGIQLVGLALLLGASGVAAAYLVGGFALRILYRPEFAAYGGLLVEVMCAALVGYLAIMLGFLVTSARAFDAQLPLFCIVVATCAIASRILVPAYGLRGAPLALAAAAGVQIVGELVILARSYRRLEHRD